MLSVQAFLLIIQFELSYNGFYLAVTLVIYLSNNEKYYLLLMSWHQSIFLVFGMWANGVNSIKLRWFLPRLLRFFLPLPALISLFSWLAIACLFWNWSFWAFPTNFLNCSSVIPITLFISFGWLLIYSNIWIVRCC